MLHARLHTRMCCKHVDTVCDGVGAAAHQDRRTLRVDGATCMQCVLTHTQRGRPGGSGGGGEELTVVITSLRRDSREGPCGPLTERWPDDCTAAEDGRPRDIVRDIAPIRVDCSELSMLAPRNSTRIPFLIATELYSSPVELRACWPPYGPLWGVRLGKAPLGADE